MIFSKTGPTRHGHWILAFGVATFIVLLIGAHSYIVSSYTGETSKWGEQFLNAATGWYVWAGLFPIILRLARSYRFNREAIFKSVLVHLFAGAFIAILHATLQVLFYDLFLHPEHIWIDISDIFKDNFVSTLFWRFFIYQALLAASIALDSYRRARETELQASQMEAGILQAQIESLKVQLDPDFLFKNLEQLSRTMKRDPDEAESMIASLGDYLRMRLVHSSSDISLREEIEFLKCYLEVENLRAGHRVSIEFHVEQKVLECAVPGTLLQAAVEDFIGSRTEDNPVHLKIGASKTDSTLVIAIQDQAGIALPQKGKLDQLSQRMNALYRSPIRVFTGPDASRRIEIPLILEKQNEEDVILHAQQLDHTNKVVDTSTPVRKWLVIIAIFTAIAVYFTIQRLAIHAIKGTNINWPQHLLDYTGWYIWALLTPLVLRVSSKYPLQRRDWMKHAFIHLIAFAMSWLGATVALSAVQWAANLGEYGFFDRLPAGIARSPFSLDIICYSTIMAIESALRYHRRFEFSKIRTIKLTAQLARARLQTLEMQLHPHFLFNALNSLSELMQEDPLAAEEMIRNLEMFLRLTLNQNHVQEIPFEQELEFLKCYLAIENVRYQDRLHVKMEIEPQAMKVRVPNLMLQPIVENAIRHGIAPRTTPGQIEIHAKRMNGMLKISIRDNGPGLSKSKKKATIARSGLGLSNTRERLSQLYGDGHRFELINAPEGGLLVTLEIPVFFTAENAESAERN